MLTTTGQLLQWKLCYPFQGALPSLMEKRKTKQPAVAEHPFFGGPAGNDQGSAVLPPDALGGGGGGTTSSVGCGGALFGIGGMSAGGGPGGGGGCAASLTPLQ